MRKNASDREILRHYYDEQIFPTVLAQKSLFIQEKWGAQDLQLSLFSKLLTLLVVGEDEHFVEYISQEKKEADIRDRLSEYIEDVVSQQLG